MGGHGRLVLVSSVIKRASQKQILSLCSIPDLFRTIFGILVQIRTKSGILDLFGLSGGHGRAVGGHGRLMGGHGILVGGHGMFVGGHGGSVGDQWEISGRLAGVMG